MRCAISACVRLVVATVAAFLSAAGGGGGVRSSFAGVGGGDAGSEVPGVFTCLLVRLRATTADTSSATGFFRRGGRL
jgi:hypothetical protein